MLLKSVMLSSCYWPLSLRLLLTIFLENFWSRGPFNNINKTARVNSPRRTSLSWPDVNVNVRLGTCFHQALMSLQQSLSIILMMIIIIMMIIMTLQMIMKIIIITEVVNAVVKQMVSWSTLDRGNRTGK